ncbi:NAD(P)/FAD-dependent oxidoreductase [Saccharibacillus kuerlensis]|uniref:NADH dehydrogenase-like protein YutJ n=1 Tax=Saccharibacillus kuerlensis TaxID=459527 RepID=A0ABQ2L4H3_9BACL|nr:NAD(P)/FAD-dependent oxidoreductase [Saccharibacillus kuerlensis]GGO02539.1 NADH dehydrogenase-like protein YutJ [Saccharibacillus kuerlensis]
MKNLVILGGGYGGLTILDELLKHIPSDVNVTLIDRVPFMGLKTEYYALAAGTVSDHKLRISFPNHPQFKTHFGTVESIDLEGKKVLLQNDEPVSYDQLVIALGCTDNYHGVPGADEFTYSIQSLHGSRRTNDKLGSLKPSAHVHIVGGGLSGIELAAELRESRHDLQITLLDRGERLLSSYQPRISRYVQEWFKKHDVEVCHKVSISRVEQGALYNGDELMDTDAVVWTAGIQPVEVVQKLNVTKDRSGRVTINEYSQIPEYPEVFVCGDCASLKFAPSAQAAEAQGEQIANILLAFWKDETPRLKPIKLKGMLGSLGQKAGFGLNVIGDTSITGRVPRLLKSGVLWMSKHNLG